MDTEFHFIRFQFGLAVQDVMNLVTKEMTLEDIKFKLSISFPEYSDEIESIESPRCLTIFVRKQSKFTHFPLLYTLCKVFELHEGMKVLEDFMKMRQQVYARLLCHDFAKLAGDAIEQKSHGKVSVWLLYFIFIRLISVFTFLACFAS